MSLRLLLSFTTQHALPAIPAEKSKESVRGLASLVLLLDMICAPGKFPIDILVKNAYLRFDVPLLPGRRRVEWDWDLRIFQFEL